MSEKDTRKILEVEGRLQSLEQQLSALQREIREVKKLMVRIRGGLNDVIDFINLDTQIEYPGEGADLRHV